MTDKSAPLRVEKIGGTSMSNTDIVVPNVLLPGADQTKWYNRIFVVSAYAGITDLLLEHKKSGEAGVYALFTSSETDWSWSDALSRVTDKMQAINADIFADHPDCQVADNFVRERVEGVRSCLLDLQRLCSYGHFQLEEHLLTIREMLSALGEAHSAHNTMLLLRQKGANASFVDLTGWRDEDVPNLDDRIQNAFDKIDLSAELPIVTGYAHCSEGLMRTYDRGYTEVTFSRIAVVLNAAQAIIHKEFHLSSADPKLVGLDKVRTIGRTNYDVADQLSNMGMEAIHPNAAKGLRQAHIPLRVKNTFDPSDLGTEISGDYVSATPGTEIVTGLKSVIALDFFEQDMVGVKGYDAAILSTLKKHNARIVSKISNANTITHYLAGSLKAVRRVVADLKDLYPSAEISTAKVALVSVIGSDLGQNGITQKAVCALGDADITLLGLHQLTRNVDIQFIVPTDSYDKTVQVLHRALVEGAEDRAALKVA